MAGLNPFTKWWLAWGAVFVAIEAAAIRRRRTIPDGSLSSLVWRFIDSDHPVRRWAFIIAWGLLTSHFVWRWPDI